MSGYLLDTNVPSELTRSNPAAALVGWVGRTSRTSFHLSVISIGEFRKGFHLLPPGKRRQELESWLENSLLTMFEDRVLPVTQVISARWGKLSAERQSMGMPISASDGLIAATALEHGLVLVTRNIKDFAGIGLELIDPWK